MASENIKAPPKLSKSSTYESWQKELQIWQAFTTLDKKKQGPAIFLTLSGKAKEAILELEVAEISAEDGVEKIIKKLDSLYQEDKVQTAYEAYDKFEKFQRPSEMAISDFIIEFERLQCRTKHYGMTMSSPILAYRLLKSANVTEHHEQLVRATVNELTYEEMKDKLKKIFGHKPDFSTSDSVQIKSEPTYESSSGNYENETMYTPQSNYRGNYNRGKFSSRGNFRGSRGSNNKPFVRHVTTRNKGKNPLDERGNITKCIVCESVNHWAGSCPDGQYFSETCDEEEPSNDTNHQVTLFQSNLILEDCMRTFTAESLCAAILDSGATSTVSGKKWMDIYIESLSPADQEKVTKISSHNSFKFGSGSVYKSLYKVKVPASVGKNSIFIESDIVETEIPMLLSRASMKKANTEINFKDDTVQMLGEKQRVIVTTSGHYAIPLNENFNILQDVTSRGASITLNVEHSTDTYKIAKKLHCQFSHANQNKLIELLKRAGMGNDDKLINCVKEVCKKCEVCRDYRRPSALPAVGLPLATKFNEVVAMDLKFFKGKIILHLIDHLTRFSAAAVLSSKKPEEVIKNIFRIWISVFGPPTKFLSDNGGEFNNEDFRILCEKYNIIVETTAAEAPWSNGLCERHNAARADMLQKTVENGISFEAALNWSIHATLKL